MKTIQLVFFITNTITYFRISNKLHCYSNVFQNRWIRAVKVNLTAVSFDFVPKLLNFNEIGQLFMERKSIRLPFV